MVSERFVQDSICRPERIRLVLVETGRTDWEFVTPDDILNQEVSFPRGRIDVLATFNRRTRIAVVEVKAGNAGIEAVNHLRSYIDNWRTMPLAEWGLDKLEPSNVIGLVLAE